MNSSLNRTFGRVVIPSHTDLMFPEVVLQEVNASGTFPEMRCEWKKVGMWVEGIGGLMREITLYLSVLGFPGVG